MSKSWIRKYTVLTEISLMKSSLTLSVNEWFTHCQKMFYLNASNFDCGTWFYSSRQIVTKQIRNEDFEIAKVLLFIEGTFNGQVVETKRINLVAK